jgi:glycosyltransferase involved in cell wall biosynthesis
MIYYLCPDTDEPFSGIKKVYSHVDILNRCGMPARVLHGKRRFRCGWFCNTTLTTALKDAHITRHDFLAVPEFYNLVYLNPARNDGAAKVFGKVFGTPAKKVIFNHGTYLSFTGSSFEREGPANLHTDPRVTAAITVSEDGQEFLSHAFPALRTFRVCSSVNSDLFVPRQEKKDQICFLSRKNRDHAVAVISILKLRGMLDGYALAPIEGRSEWETAEVMKESSIFLSFGFPQGFPLSPAEAMACGCIVIGYHGMGGREYFLPDFCFPVETGNILEFARTVEGVITSLKFNPEPLKRMALRGSAHVREVYSPFREQEDVLRCWKTLLEEA